MDLGSATLQENPAAWRCSPRSAAPHRAATRTWQQGKNGKDKTACPASQAFAVLKSELKTDVKMSGISRMLCVYRRQSYIGFIVHSGSSSFEAFDTGEHSIGVFADQRAAAAAVANFSNDQTENLQRRRYPLCKRMGRPPPTRFKPGSVRDRHERDFQQRDADGLVPPGK
jgi:hypothetical protein